MLAEARCLKCYYPLKHLVLKRFITCIVVKEGKTV